MKNLKQASKLNLGDIIELSSGFAVVSSLMTNRSGTVRMVRISTKHLMNGEKFTFTTGAETMFEVFVAGNEELEIDIDSIYRAWD